MPTWEERVFAPRFYAETNEQIMVVVNSFCILLCLALMAFVCVHYRSAVIRAATPSFSIVIIIGAILMLISNYFESAYHAHTHGTITRAESQRHTHMHQAHINLIA